MEKRTLSTTLAVATATESGTVRLRRSNVMVKITHNLTTASGSAYVDLYPNVSLDNGTTWNRLTTPTVQIAATGSGTKFMNIPNLPPAIPLRIEIVKTGTPAGPISSIEFVS